MIFNVERARFKRHDPAGAGVFAAPKGRGAVPKEQLELY